MPFFRKKISIPLIAIKHLTFLKRCVKIFEYNFVYLTGGILKTDCGQKSINRTE